MHSTKFPPTKPYWFSGRSKDELFVLLSTWNKNLLFFSDSIHIIISQSAHISKFASVLLLVVRSCVYLMFSQDLHVSRIFEPPH